MNKLFQENGSLTKEGELFIVEFRHGLLEIAESDEIRDMTDDELRTLQANLAKLVGETIFKRVSRNIQFTNDLCVMSDEQFYAHLNKKYGTCWALHSLEKEERIRFSQADLQKLADDGDFINENIRKYMISKGVRFK
jgi:hypothetical protein